jgi:hypothetical protein
VSIATNISWLVLLQDRRNRKRGLYPLLCFNVSPWICVADLFAFVGYHTNKINSHCIDTELPLEDVKNIRLHLDRGLYLAKNTFSQNETTRNHPHQNVLVTHTQVKTLHKQQTSHIYKVIHQSGLTEYNSGDSSHFHHRSPRTLTMESSAYDCGRTLVCAKYSYPKGSPNTNS